MKTHAAAIPHEDEEQRNLLRDSVAAFADKDAKVGRLRALRDRTPNFDPAVWRHMADLGWTGLLVPESAGGLGLGLPDMAVVAEELGKVLAPEPLLESAVHAALVLDAALPQVTAAELLRGLTAGQCVPVVAWQESDANLSATPVRTVTRSTASGHVLDGVKTAVALGGDADGLIVSARTNAGTGLFWVERARPGVRVERRALTGAAHHATVTLTAVELPAEALLLDGERAAQALARANDGTRVVAAAYLLGLMCRAFDMTLDYLRTRQQFGRPIGSFQALQHRAVNLFIQTQLTSAVVNEAARAFGACADPVQRALLASRAKHRATVAAQLVTRDAIQMFGAIGYTEECDIGLYLDRALVLEAWLGNASWQRQRISAEAPYAVEVAAATPGAPVPAEPPDRNWNSMTDDDFRALVRAWLTAECPAELRNRSSRPRWDDSRDWYIKLSKQGWVAPAWPAEHGGMGLAPSKLLIFIEEQERLGIARSPDMGIVMVGPLIINHGSDEQRRRYLPKILAGEHVWCQGYSEPNAGSDLASLRTEAVLDGDEFVVNGQKIWTTLAQDATHIFLLARTDKQAKKQQGISFLLIDMQTPGITIRPIRNIAGHEEFCEVFFDNVRTPAENLVGGINNGWTIAKALLGFERLFLGGPKQSQYALQRLAALAEGWHLFADPVFVDRFTHLRLDVLDLESTYTKFAGIVKAGGRLGPDVSLLKIWATEAFSRLTELMVEAAGSRGAELGKSDFGGADIDVMSLFYNARPATIYGGSNEIQRNIVAKNVLRLPDA